MVTPIVQERPSARTIAQEEQAEERLRQYEEEDRRKAQIAKNKLAWR